MSDISKIKLPDGEIYNIKDIETRKGLEYLLGKEYWKNQENEEDTIKTNNIE